jgi:hypothetical protein
MSDDYLPQFKFTPADGKVGVTIRVLKIDESSLAVKVSKLFYTLQELYLNHTFNLM